MSIKTISGKAVFKDLEPAIGSKLILTKASETQRLNSKGIGEAVVDVDGNWSMILPPKIGVEDRWLLGLGSDGSKIRQKLKANQTTYPLNFGDAMGMNMLDEVVITANRPKPAPAPVQPTVAPVSWFDKNKLWVMIGSGVLVTTVAIIIIVGSRKNKDK